MERKCQEKLLIIEYLSHRLNNNQGNISKTE